MKNLIVIAEGDVNNRCIYYILIIIFLSLLSLISFIKIIIFYLNQNKMISLLFSLDERIAKEILWSIRTLKGLLLQRGQESELEEEEDEKANLIQNGSVKDEIEEKGKEKSKINEKLELNEKLAKRSKSFIFK